MKASYIYKSFLYFSIFFACIFLITLCAGDGSDDLIHLERDTDGDGVIDTADNCPQVLNPDQKNSNTDALGDACNDDDDGDAQNDDVDIDDDGDGLIEISSAEQLAFMRNNLAGTHLNDGTNPASNNGCGNGRSVLACNGYELIANIRLTNDWIPVGNCGNGAVATEAAGVYTEVDCNSNGFTGTFNGNDYTVSNINIRPAKNMAETTSADPRTRSGDRGVGFFGAIGNTAVIRNFHLEDVEIIGGAFRIGLLVGHSIADNSTGEEDGAEIINVSAEGHILRESSSITAITNQADCEAASGTFINNKCDRSIVVATQEILNRDECDRANGVWANLVCTVTQVSAYDVGGLVGTADRLLIRNSYVRLSEINGAQLVGGLVAKARNSTIEGSYARIVTMRSYANTRINALAGFIGDAEGTTIHSSYANSEFIGLHTPTQNNLAMLNAITPHMSPFIGIGNGTTITNSYAVATTLQISSIYREGNTYYAGGLLSNVPDIAPTITRSYWHITNLNRPNIWTLGMCFNASDRRIIRKDVTTMPLCEMNNNLWRPIGRCSNGMVTDMATCMAADATWTAENCSDGTSTDEGTCTAGNQIWTTGSCSDGTSATEAICMAAGATWTAENCSDGTSTAEATCIMGNQIWTAGSCSDGMSTDEGMCIAGNLSWELGNCSDGTSTTEASCNAATGTWITEGCDDGTSTTERECTASNHIWRNNADIEGTPAPCSDSSYNTEADCTSNSSSITERNELRDNGAASKTQNELQVPSTDNFIYEGWNAAGCTTMTFTPDSKEDAQQAWTFPQSSYPALNCFATPK